MKIFIPPSSVGEVMKFPQTITFSFCPISVASRSINEGKAAPKAAEVPRPPKSTDTTENFNEPPT